MAGRVVNSGPRKLGKGDIVGVRAVQGYDKLAYHSQRAVVGDPL